MQFVQAPEGAPSPQHGILRTSSGPKTSTSPKKHAEFKKEILLPDPEEKERQAAAQAVQALASEAKKRAEKSAYEAKHGPIYDSDEKKTLLRLLSLDDTNYLNRQLSKRVHRVLKGHVLIRCGDPGTSMFFVEQGECITSNGVKIPAGSFFGERAFLMALSTEEEKKNTNPIIGAIASLWGSPGDNKPSRSSDVLVSSEHAIVQELEYQAAADIMCRNEDALNFLRSTSTQRMKPSQDRLPQALILW